MAYKTKRIKRKSPEQKHKSYWKSLSPEQRKKAWHFLKRNFSITDMWVYGDEYLDNYLKASEKEWKK